MRIIFYGIAFLVHQFVQSNAGCKDPTPHGRCSGCKPVCGSDGYTYTDICFLESYNKSCKKDVKSSYDGPCKKNISPPVESCYPASQFCTKTGSKDYNPVCGSDKVTYGNACEFNYQRTQKSGLNFVKCGSC